MPKYLELIIILCYLYFIETNPASQMPKQIRKAAVIRMRNLREYKQYLKENGAEYKEGEVHPIFMSFEQFKRVGVSPLDEMYKTLEIANQAWYNAEMRGQDVINDITCDGYHARRNAMRLVAEIEKIESLPQ